MYQIEFTQEALDDLTTFKKAEQNKILDGIEGNCNSNPQSKLVIVRECDLILWRNGN